MSPGCTCVSFEACFRQTFTTASQSLDHVTTILPPRPPDAAKAKPVQAALPALSSGAESCGWDGVSFSVEVTFTRPIVPEWCPPPKPTKTLSDVLPGRQVFANADGIAVGNYKARLQCVCTIGTCSLMSCLISGHGLLLAGIAARLLREYVHCSQRAKESGLSVAPESLRQKLVFDLNRSGLYVSMKEQLRSCVLSIGKEKFDAGTTREMGPVCSKVYACMLDEMHSWLKQAAGTSVMGQSVAAHSAALLLALASECELVGDNRRAMQLHEERCTLQDDVLM